MASVADLLRGMGPEVEAQLKPNLQGFFGGMVRGYLPQAWVFTTESETVTFQVDAEGNVTIRDGAAPAPDVVVQGTQAALTKALGTRNASLVPPGSIKAKPVTAKGNVAFNFLRSRLGL